MATAPGRGTGVDSAIDVTGADDRDIDLWVGRGVDVYGVVGFPLVTTWSPRMMNAAFRHAGHAAVYLPFRVSPPEFSSALDRWRDRGVKGVNVTQPFKRDARAWATASEAPVDDIDSANVLMLDERVAASTDGAGFLDDLRERGRPVGGAHAWCFGWGGAARAIVGAWVGAGGTMSVFSRRPAEGLPLGGTAYGWDDAARAGLPTLVVNATPVGGRSTLPVAWGRLTENCLLVDLAYGDHRFPWLDEGRTRGHLAVDGRGMLVHQAARTFARWMGEPAPVDVLWAAIGGRT